MTDDLRDYVEKWQFRANEDIRVVDELFQTDPQAYASTICFHAQQAVEKLLKAFLAFQGIDFPKTHDLDYLLDECQKIAREPFEQIDLKSLADFGVSVRYPDDFYVPSPSEVTYYRNLAKQVEHVVDGLIRFE